MPPERKPVQKCGAKTRSGSACEQTVVNNGSNRCRMHGASAGPPKGNQNASKLGIYAAVLSDEDRAVGEASQVGSVEAEIAIIRIQLHRCIRTQKAYDAVVAEGEVPTKFMVMTRLARSSVEVTDEKESGGGQSATNESKSSSRTSEDKVLERPDFEGLIDRWTSRLEKLERLQAELTGGLMPPGDGEGNGATINVKVTGGLPD